MPGPCSAPLGYRDEKGGKTPRTGKTDVAKRGMPRKAAVDLGATMRARLAELAED